MAPVSVSFRCVVVCVLARRETATKPQNDLRDESPVPDFGREVDDRPVVSQGDSGGRAAWMELAKLLGDTAGGRHPRVDEAELVHRTTFPWHSACPSWMRGSIRPGRRIRAERPNSRGRRAPMRRIVRQVVGPLRVARPCPRGARPSVAPTSGLEIAPGEAPGSDAQPAERDGKGGDDPITPIVGTLALTLFALAVAGVGMAVGGLVRPGLAAPAAALVVLATFLIDILVPALKLPEEVREFALTAHFGSPMLGTWDPVGIVASLAIAFGGLGIGAWGFTRRDLKS